ncbi:dual specificity catalytic domain containing protein [Stylonychia lemnae]|uniref:protein-tyrosine-phosphatase n=1 Tax=Stylonychia lemnae TaxID=5949 RepID=A0A077ZYK6_STYLE|nr:dual specificity catalytic domain containing protein [Stylonychia lemnae]|eukprot:CDW75026.1 dual specificity catalytic domain containing protein [Stylonychia lemnae]
MQSTLSCIVCDQTISESVKKDLPVCQSCFDQVYNLEKQTIRKKKNEEADHICDNLYLGSENSVLDLEYLRRNKIDRIIVAAAFCDKKFNQEEHQIAYLTLEIDDSPEEDIKKYFEETHSYINQNKETNVIVHCVSGISRSGTIVISYVMKHKNLRFQEAWEYVKSKRSIVYPNSGFQKQLLQYEQELFQENQL